MEETESRKIRMTVDIVLFEYCHFSAEVSIVAAFVCHSAERGGNIKHCVLTCCESNTAGERRPVASTWRVVVAGTAIACPLARFDKWNPLHTWWRHSASKSYTHGLWWSIVCRRRLNEWRNDASAFRTPPSRKCQEIVNYEFRCKFQLHNSRSHQDRPLLVWKRIARVHSSFALLKSRPLAQELVPKILDVRPTDAEWWSRTKM